MLNKIINILRVNNIEYDINLRNLDQDIKNEHLEIKNELLKNFYDKLEYFINNGFDKKSQKTILALSKLLYELTVENTARKTTNIINNIKEKLNELNRDEDVQYVFYDDLDQLIGVSILGAEALYELHNVEFVNQCKESFIELKNELAKVLDKTSVSAAQYQRQIYEIVYNLGENLSRYRFTEEDLKAKFNDAKELIYKWQELNKYDSSRKSRQSFDLSTIRLNGLQKAYLNKDFISKIKATNNMLQMDKNLIEKYNPKNDRDELNNLNAELEEYDMQLINLLTSYENGRISDEEYVFNSRLITNSKTNQENRIYFLTERINRNSLIYTSRLTTINNLNNIINEIGQIKNEVHEFYNVIEDINIDGIANIMPGTHSESQENQVMFELDEMIKRLNSRIAKAKQTEGQINNIIYGNRVEMTDDIQRQVPKTDVKAEIEKLKKNAEELRKKKFGAKTGLTQTEEPAKIEEEIKKKTQIDDLA